MSGTSCDGTDTARGVVTESVIASPVGTYASFAIPAYRLLFAVGVFGFLATQVQIIARGWLANELSGSNRGLGGVFMAFGLPMLVAIPFGGVAADRYSKRRILIVTFLVLAVSAAFIGLGVMASFIVTCGRPVCARMR